MDIFTRQQHTSATKPRAGSGAGDDLVRSKVRVRLVDHRGRTRAARLPTHVPIKRLKERIVERLENSQFDSNGNAVVYDLVHNGRVLGEEETLEAIGIQPDEQMELSPSIQSAGHP